MQKLTAGSGYDYLTRQVAALDSTEKGHTGLAAYYANAARSQGCGWVRGWSASTVSTPATRSARSRCERCSAGMHPLVELRLQQLGGPDLTESDYLAVTRLGAPFKVLDRDVSPFRVEVAKRIAAINESAGSLPRPCRRLSSGRIRPRCRTRCGSSRSRRCSRGPARIRQVNVRGLVAAAFTHRDSRAGDPDLHTHVAVANKVQTLDGRYAALPAVVAAAPGRSGPTCQHGGEDASEASARRRLLTEYGNSSPGAETMPARRVYASESGSAWDRNAWLQTLDDGAGDPAGTRAT
jgi:hypothetical protein